MRTKPKPEHLNPEYAAQFSDASVARAYYTRPPYPEEIFDTLEALIPQRPRRVLELGCGAGDLTIELARRVDHLDAVEPSEAMLAEARQRDGAVAPNIHWHLASAEQFQIAGTYSLACAGASLHWMDWDVVLPKVASGLEAGGMLAIIDRELECPWNKEILKLIPAYSTNKKFQRYDLIDELSSRELFKEAGRKTTAPVPFSQSIEDYIESFHSRNGFSRERMGRDAAGEFDAAVREVVSRQGARVDGVIIATIVWGRPG
jgi:trans-aconitate methyltransferase